MQNTNATIPLIWIINSRNTNEEKQRIVQLLLDAGADITIKSTFGKTARDYALQQNLPEIVKILDEAAAQQKEKKEAQEATLK